MLKNGYFYGAFILLAVIGVYIYVQTSGAFDEYILSEGEQNLTKLTEEVEVRKIASLSNIRRNFWLLVFALVGGGLAIWGRFAYEKQIKLTRKANNNATFIKAVEILSDSKGEISVLGGLQIIIALAKDEPEFEYIRCKEFICNWLRHNYPADRKKKISPAVASLVYDFLGTKFKGAEKYVKAYTKKQKHECWPDLSKIKFAYLDFKDIYLEKAYLEKANFEKTNLKDANLKDADLSSANLQDADLRNANLRRVSLWKANLQGAKLHNADLQGADLSSANLQDTKFHHAKLQGVRFRHTNLQDAVLYNADLRGANFYSADLQGANLKDANISDAKMKEAKNLTKEQIISARWFSYGGRNPPELPDELSKDPEIQECLAKPRYSR